MENAMSSVKHLLNDPYQDVDISLMIPSTNFDMFYSLYNTIINTCSSPNKVELLLKIDVLKDFEKFYELCDSSPFKYKILTYPKHNKRCSLHLFFNDLADIASGKFMWVLGEDSLIQTKGWYDSFMETRGAFPDNIYCVVSKFEDERGRGFFPTPAITKEWHKTFGYLTKFPNYDRWLGEIARQTNRIVLLKNLKITMPKGRRVLSKQDRKDVFYPALKKAVRRLKKKLK